MPENVGLFGDDSIVGGSGDDQLFGQLGDDLIWGDEVSGDPPAQVPGDDYIEGGGGDDLIVGGMGQDDLIGGNSSLFGLGDVASRPDGSDTIYGGLMVAAPRNDLGDASRLGHTRDEDVIAGDNANIFRLVGTHSSTGNSVSRSALRRCLCPEYPWRFPPIHG